MREGDPVVLADVPGLVLRGVESLRTTAVGHAVRAAPVFGLFVAGRVAATTIANGGSTLAAIAVDVATMVAATVVALPWFAHALTTDRLLSGETARGTDEAVVRFGAMTVGSIFFWAGVLLGLRYLFGIPSIFVLMMYAFFGYAIADGETSGLHALGTSVRIGQGRRVVIAAVAVFLLFVNLVGAAPLSGGLNAMTFVATAVLMWATTSVSMGAGAHLYRRLLLSEEVEGRAQA